MQDNTKVREITLENRKQIRKRKRRKLTWKFILLIVAAVVAYSIYFFVNVYAATKEAHEEIDRPDNKSALREEEVDFGGDPISILLMGVDDGASGQNGRADSLIVATLNPNTKQVSLTTVPRDTKMDFTADEVDPAYVGYHKINAAYSYGSMFGYGANKLTVEKVEQLLDIPIDEYVAVNFEGFSEVVDALGGVTIDVKEPFSQKSHIKGGETFYFEKGEQKMNGEEALAFVRMRKQATNNIYSREERQRQFIKATLNQAISTDTLFKVGELANIIGSNVKTSLSPSELFQLQKLYSSINASEIKTYEIEGQDEKIEGIYYFIPSEEGLTTISNQLKQELEL